MLPDLTPEQEAALREWKGLEDARAQAHEHAQEATDFAMTQWHARHPDGSQPPEASVLAFYRREWEQQLHHLAREYLAVQAEGEANLSDDDLVYAPPHPAHRRFRPVSLRRSPRGPRGRDPGAWSAPARTGRPRSSGHRRAAHSGTSSGGGGSSGDSSEGDSDPDGEPPPPPPGSSSEGGPDVDRPRRRSALLPARHYVLRVLRHLGEGGP